jgi:bla regulator protein blaR1
MHRAAAAMIAILWFTAVFAGQEFPTENATVLAFDVVSIKSLDGIARSRMRGARQSQGRFARAAATLRQLVQYAYDVQPLQVTGGPGWVSTSRFQVDARTERTTTPAQMRAMVRQMLAERFALKAHTDVRDRPIYRMVVARADGKLGPAIYHIDDAECGGSNPQPCDLAAWSGGLMSSGMGLQQLAVTLFNRSQSTGIDRLVIDQTGLAGMFGFTLMFSSSFDTVPHVSNDPSIFTALREQLGLKLEPARGPVELIVIDSVERPTAN